MKRFVKCIVACLNFVWKLESWINKKEGTEAGSIIVNALKVDLTDFVNQFNKVYKTMRAQSMSLHPL